MLKEVMSKSFNDTEEALLEIRDAELVYENDEDYAAEISSLIPLQTLYDVPPPSTVSVALTDPLPSTSMSASMEETALQQVLKPRSRNHKSHSRRRSKRGEERATAKDAKGPDHADLPERVAKRIKLSTEDVQTELSTKDLPVAHGGYEGRGGYIKGYTVPVTPSKGLGMGFRVIKIDPKR